MAATTRSRSQRVIAIFAILAAVVAVLVTTGLNEPPVSLTPASVYGLVVPGLVIAVGIDMLVGAAVEAGDDGFPTLSQALVVLAWTCYLGAGLAFLAAGYTGWIVVTHLVIAVGAGVVAVVGLSRRQ